MTQNQMIKFKDSICIAQPSKVEAIDNANSIIDRDRKVSLKVKIDATHSGVLTNMRVYPGKKVQEGYKTFFSKDRGGLAEFDKPILKHHESWSDPVGRIINAQFTQLKNGRDFEFDYLSPDPFGQKGSGVVTIEGIISDQDTIKKIVDGRFISVSSGHHTDEALCSICGDSIMSCEHIPGRKYDADGDLSKDEDANTCYVITNNMFYDELSFVNIPAQPSAKLKNFNWEGTDSYKGKDGFIIESQLIGAKETVRTFSLCDADDELNLLTGKKLSDSKKTMVALNIATADKLKRALSLPEANDDDDNVRQPEDGQKVEHPEPDPKANQPLNKDNDMDTNELQKQLNSLKDELSAAKTKVTDLESSLANKDKELTASKEAISALDNKTRKSLATSLAGLKIRLKKPDSIGLDTKDKVNQFIDTLAKRTIESLEDAVSDLLVELENYKETPKQDKSDNKTANELLSDGNKVEDPTSKKGNQPLNKTKSKDSKLVDAVSAIDQELGL